MLQPSTILCVKDYLFIYLFIYSYFNLSDSEGIVLKNRHTYVYTVIFF